MAAVMHLRNHEATVPQLATAESNLKSNGVHATAESRPCIVNGHDSADTEIPVLIVGAGPCGLLQAYLLSKLNVPCMIIERYVTRLAAPKAHALSPRSLEICRQVGLDANAIRKLGSPRTDARWVNFVTTLRGELVGRLPYERMDPGVLDATPEMIHNIPQPTFEQYVADHLPETVKVVRPASFVSCEERADRIFTTYEDRETGELRTVSSQYVIACDGAKGRVRSHLGVECEGEDTVETMMTIHFNADLRPVIGDRVGMLHWVMDPGVSGFIIAYDLSGNEVLICNVDPKKQPLDSWDEEICRNYVKAAIGQDVPFEILSFRPWVLSRKVARQYRRGRVFLAGDAAHAFPPTGGLGLNSGLADVHNLAYKIAAAYHGWAGDGLLDTYESERRHIANVNAQQSVKNGKQILALLKALGTATSDVEQARKNLTSSLRVPERRLWIDEEIREQQEHFDNLELHIGYVYGSLEFPPHASKFTPKFVPGARLPHVWIRPSPQLKVDLPAATDLRYIKELDQHHRETMQYSSLDLCGLDAFTIITSSSADTLAAIETALCSISGGHIPVKVVKFPEDFSVVPSEAGDAWIKALSLRDGGAVLVRPDQHILTIVRRGESAGEIGRLIKSHLGR